MRVPEGLVTRVPEGLLIMAQADQRTTGLEVHVMRVQAGQLTKDREAKRTLGLEVRCIADLVDRPMMVLAGRRIPVQAGHAMPDPVVPVIRDLVAWPKTALMSADRVAPSHSWTWHGLKSFFDCDR